jgi:hypothetical protein
MPLFTLIYFSHSRMNLEYNPICESLNTLLETSNRNNESNGITGALVFDSDWFVQCLEGERDQIWSTFQKIECDPRHAHVTVVEMLRTDGRSFGKWWMGCAEKNRNNAILFEPYMRGGGFRPDLLTRIELRALLSVLGTRGLSAHTAETPVP